MRIEAVIGDITTQEVDAVVNAANSSLLGGGGVDGAIHRAAGPRLLEACRELRATELRDGLPVGRAVATPAFDLPARWVIHTVGPNRHAGQDDPALLRAAFDSSLALAAELGCRSVALPAVSAGAYGWGLQEVARIAVASARALAGMTGEPRGGGQPHEGGGLELVRFVLFSRPALVAFEGELEG
ncbi:O-acetyl-ADP-ribose deacetylase [Actinomyces bowdenii]|uniref:O-acetyl-ADP-ribose deacetylase n=1 Tax=Actinomyces bowdenii TaxID=131109 RepID=A0A3P1V3Z8_9ACTO|nr:O-acetyl-ADP-ribose deacetylase [Actinomyces bowdenii]RRD28914.1 O-acetyl-ADP-ribose deacetylase [Actinomyces bowdenii]